MADTEPKTEENFDLSSLTEGITLETIPEDPSKILDQKEDTLIHPEKLSSSYQVEVRSDDKDKKKLQSNSG
jgi:hypothetical protein